MIRTLLFASCLAILAACSTNTTPGKPDVSYAPQVEELLSQMTVKEKIGQMTQVTLGAINDGKGADFELDKDSLRWMIVDYGVGSFLNCAGQARSRNEWSEIIGEMQRLAMEESRLNIPILYGIDAIHGTNYTLDATLFPQQVGLAATWNPALVETAAAMCAYETRASSIPWTFSPVLDLGIDPRWPRLWEGFGEDPYLQGQMGVAMTAGFQGENVGSEVNIAACLKHYIGYGAPRSGKDRTPAWIPEIMMREFFIPPFQEAINAGAKTIMINSGEVNGEPVHASKFLLTEVLRGELGFTGVAVTDWYDIINLVERHHTADTEKEAVRQAIEAGIDMSMVPYDVSFADHLLELVEEGTISEARLDESVRRILQLKVDLNLWENPVMNPADYPGFASEEHRRIARSAAYESITLLKNEDNILPFARDARVLVTGPNANSMRTLNGGWTYTWQGDQTDRFLPKENTILEALQKTLGESNVVYQEGVRYKPNGAYWEDEVVDLYAVTRAAAGVEYIILCLGENSYTEKPGDLNSLMLSKNQLALAQVAASTGKPVILVLNEGRPRIIADIVADMDAIVQLYLPGNHGGEALADILVGGFNPSGKLPYTYPRHVNDLVPYHHKFSENVPHNDGNEYLDPLFHPQFEFGYGLSYTSFEYSDLRVTENAASGTLNIQVTVKNTGDMNGAEVVQLFTTDVVATITPSVKRLRAFEKVQISAGAARDISFTLPLSDLGFINRQGEKVVEPGEFIIRVGNLSHSYMLASAP